MSESKMIENVVTLVRDDPELANFFIAEPQAIVMPFAREKNKRFLFVAIFVVQQACSFEVLTSLCRRVIRILRRGGFLRGLDGLEIVPAIVSANETKRILRLSILADALGHAELLSSDELQQKCPAKGKTYYTVAKGMTCIVYEPDLLKN